MSIRSKYIKSLIEDKESLSKTLTETTHNALQEMVDEAVAKSMKKAINEAADSDSYEEEEVKDLDVLDDVEAEPSKSEDGEAEAEKDADVEADAEDKEESDVVPELTTSDENSAESADEEDVWSSLEQYKDENGEYDLTGMDKEEYIKVLKVMKPENGDSVRIMKVDDSRYELKDDETGSEYVIELGEDEAPEAEYEISFDGVDECDNKVVKEDLGYTDNYNDTKSQISSVPNHEVANPSETITVDAGVPSEGEKPYPGEVEDKVPYNEEKEFDVELEMDESTTVADKNPQANGTTKTHGPNTSRRAARNGSVAGRKVKPTSVPRYSQEQVESIMRKANTIFNENKQLKSIAEQIKNRLNEACVVNASLAKIIKLVTENTTTRDEKVNIVNRFNNVKSINEGKELYNTISEELKKSHPINDVSKMVDGQLSESKKNNIVETSMYQSADLYATLDLMKRLDQI